MQFKLSHYIYHFILLMAFNSNLVFAEATLICHKILQQTISVNEIDLTAHLNHGDSIGECKQKTLKCSILINKTVCDAMKECQWSLKKKNCVDNTFIVTKESLSVSPEINDKKQVDKSPDKTLKPQPLPIRKETVIRTEETTIVSEKPSEDNLDATDDSENKDEFNNRQTQDKINQINFCSPGLSSSKSIEFSPVTGQLKIKKITCP